MNNFQTLPPQQMQKKSFQWFFHPNETYRMLRNRLFDTIDIKTDLSPNYSDNPKIGVVIGTYGSIPYIDMELYYLKEINGIKHILIHDDCSPNKDELLLLCKKYSDENCKVQFYSPKEKLFFYKNVGSIGDQNAFLIGLDWARSNKLDILVKMSRRLIPCYRWIDDFKKLIKESDGVTFSSYCYQDRFPIRTQLIAMNVNAWTNEFIMTCMKWYVDNEICVFAEFYFDELAKMIDAQNFSKKYEEYKKNHHTGYLYSGYVHWYDILGNNRKNLQKRKEGVKILWHEYNKPQDYWNQSKEIFGDKYTLKDFENN